MFRFLHLPLPDDLHLSDDFLLNIFLKNFSQRIFSLLLLILAVGVSHAADPNCPAYEGFFISGIQFQGLNQTRSSVVKNAIENRQGGSFSCKAWETERNRLKDLDIFADVTLVAQAKQDSVSLLYRFRELPPYLPLASVNKTDQDGLSIGPSIAALNFLGTGKRINVMARFGGTTEYQAEVSGRQLFGHSAEFSMAWIHGDSYNSFDSTHENSHRIKAEGFWPLVGARQFGIVGLAEYFRIQSTRDSLTLRNNNVDVVPRLGVGFRWDTRDRSLLPRRGFFAETRFTENGGYLGGPADFWEEMTDLRVYLPITKRNGFTGNVLYQYRDGVVNQNLGRYDLFHTGGANTLRGYSDNSFNGQNECLLNAEYRFDAVEERIQKLGPWSLNYGVQLVSGWDAASLWDGNSSKPEVFHHGFYAGIHLLIPGMERIRLEVGSRTTKVDLRVHFGLFEKTTVQRFRTR